jgi:hypothetical protein
MVDAVVDTCSSAYEYYVPQYSNNICCVGRNVYVSVLMYITCVWVTSKSWPSARRRPHTQSTPLYELCSSTNCS